MTGRLYVFEGPDGVGKSELCKRFSDYLARSDIASLALSFPGRDPGTLGKHVYDLHHDPGRFGIKQFDPAILQMLHVAAHLDTIQRSIIPALTEGRSVVLDRFWWSTEVYGVVGGANASLLRKLIDLELEAWGDLKPTAVFVIQRGVPLRPEKEDLWIRLQTAYEALARREAKNYLVVSVDNNHTIQDAFAQILRAASPVDSGGANRVATNCREASPAERAHAPYGFSSLAPAKTTLVYDTFWRFATERQAIFFRRLRGTPPPWTEDPILAVNKFTNAYRASDRASQFLIRYVIDEGSQHINEVVFRVLLFKIFNKIETWRLIKSKLGAISAAEFDFKRYDRILTSALESGRRIFSAAYIMPSGDRDADGGRKHRSFLILLQRMLRDELPMRLADCRRMSEAFLLLRDYPMIGDFLAYQYVTDINYSSVTDFSEREFVVPGPGARDGIRKCFDSLGGLNETEIIKLVCERQESEFSERGLEFQTLWGRPLQYIDCQNLFCEISKYARVRHPEVSGLFGRTRIKQKFRPSLEPLDTPKYPSKWGIDEKVAASCTDRRTGELPFLEFAR
ncbi:MAG TPA: nucleotide kinase domain-containing protein [Planctomycetota bacterium]